MTIDEQAVYVTTDGLGRAAIVKRSDGFYCIFIHWIWSDATKKVFKVIDGGRSTWIDDNTSIDLLYRDIDPETGVYGTIADAENFIKGLSKFSDAKRMPID